MYKNRKKSLKRFFQKFRKNESFFLAGYLEKKSFSHTHNKLYSSMFKKIELAKTKVEYKF